MSSARSLRRGRVWLRVLALLLAVLVPVAPAAACATPVVVAESAEYDVLDTALRPPARAAHRPPAPLRPAPLPEPAPGVPADPALPAPPSPPSVLHALRTVVLRC